MLQLTPIFVLLIIFGFIYGIVALSIRRKERQVMIEKGVDASVFTPKRNTSVTLKFGLLFVGLAIGIILGNILYHTGVMDEESAYFSMIFLFGGIALIVDFFIERNELKMEGDKKFKN